MKRQSSLLLPITKRKIYRIGFGCEALGGFNWGQVDIAAIEAAIANALTGARDSGQAVLFDTADTYGPHLSEIRLGRVLGGIGDEAVVATKFGVRLRDGRAWYDTSIAWADEALDGSLRRLSRPHVDLYQLHWPDKITPLCTTIGALEKFREEGRILSYGVCNVPPSDLLPLVPDSPGLATFSLSYNLLCRADHSDIQALCNAGLVFLAYGCLAQGLLSGKYDVNTRFGKDDRRSNSKYVNFHGDKLRQNLRIVDRLKQQAERLSRPAATLALQFVLADLPNAVALAGIKSTDQWTQSLAALRTALPDDTQLALLKYSDEAAI